MNSKTNKAPGIFLTHEYIIILKDYSDSLVNPSSTRAYSKGYKESRKYLYSYKEDTSNTNKYFQKLIKYFIIEIIITRKTNYQLKIILNPQIYKEIIQYMKAN